MSYFYQANNFIHVFSSKYSSRCRPRVVKRVAEYLVSSAFSALFFEYGIDKLEYFLELGVLLISGPSVNLRGDGCGFESVTDPSCTVGSLHWLTP